jgi:FkbM family methyltransferase
MRWTRAAKQRIFDRYFSWCLGEFANARPASNFQLPLLPSALHRHGFSPQHIIDVGANRGEWTRTTLNYFPEAHYTLVEPQDHLKQHVQDLLARGDGKIRWIAAGAGDKPGILPLTVSHRDDSSSFAVSAATAKARGWHQIKVPIVTLNDLVRDSNAPFPEMVKIDAEAFDLKVIAGASELLGKTDIFFLETTVRPPSDYQNTLETTVATMSQAGYHVIDITDLNRSPRHDVLFLCELAFLRNASPLLAELDYE